MGNKNYRITTLCLMRVSSTSDIQKCYDKKIIEFGCPANWLDKAIKHNNQSIGDYYECVFAHLPKGDSRVNSVKDVKGNPMGDNLLVSEDRSDGSSHLRQMSTILMPVLCFFSFNVAKMEETDREGKSTKPFIFDLDEYRADMGYKEDDASFLFITKPELFFEDLKQRVPCAVKANTDKLTFERFYRSFNPDEPIIFGDVDYDKYEETTPFYYYPNGSEELFWKLPRYKWQSELRIAISNLNFKKKYDSVSKYDYKKNKLCVSLTHLHEYAEVFSASKAHSLYFLKSEEKQTYDFRVLSLRANEVWDNIEQNNGVLII